MIFLGLFCDFLLESGWIPLMHTWYMGILFIIIGNVLVMGPMIQLIFRIFHFDSKAVHHESVADTYRFLRDAVQAKRAAHSVNKD